MKLIPLSLAAVSLLMSCTRAPVEGDGSRPITAAMAATPGGKLYRELRGQWRKEWWDVFWPTLQKDGSIVCRVGTLAIPKNRRVVFGLPSEPTQEEPEMFGGFRVIVSEAASGFHIQFADVAMVGSAGSITKPTYRPRFQPEWVFWDGVRRAFLASFAEQNTKVDADPPSMIERASGDPYEAQRRLMGLGDPLNNQ